MTTASSTVAERAEPSPLRWVLAGVLAALLVLLVAASLAGAWTRAVLLDTDRYVATVAPLVDDPAVQDGLTEQLTGQVVSTVEAEIEELPAFVQGPLLALTNRLEGLVEDAVGSIVRSEEFAQAWEAANRSAHEQVVGALTGTSTTVSITEGQVSIRAQAFADVAQESLEAAGFGQVAALIPAVQGSVVVLRSDALPVVQATLRVLDVVGAWLWLPTLLLAAAVVLLAPRRLLGGVLAAGSVALGAVLLLAAVAAVGRLYAQSPTPLPDEAKEAIYTQVTSLLTGSTLAVLGAATLVLVVLGVVTLVRRTGPPAPSL